MAAGSSSGSREALARQGTELWVHSGWRVFFTRDSEVTTGLGD